MKIAYITGTSYSGSTLLGAILGLQQDSCCVGELGSWTLREGSEQLACSCGIIRKECLFWVQVKTDWLRDETIAWNSFCNIQSTIERFLAVSQLRVVPTPTSQVIEQYSHLTRKLYQTLADVSGKQYIIDISKRVGRASALARVKDLDIAYIHLVRDGRGFLASSLKRFKKKQEGHQRQKGLLVFLLRSSLEWVLINRAAERIASSSGKPYLRVRYEDLISNPAETLNQIGNLLDVGMDGIMERVVSSTPIPLGHIGGGNLSHLTRPITFHLEDSWKQSTTFSAQRLFWFLAGATARRYGYFR